MTERGEHDVAAEVVPGRGRITLEMVQGRSTCSIEEAAVLLGVGRSTAYAAARDGSLPTLRVSHRLLVPTARLRVMLGLGETSRSGADELEVVGEAAASQSSLPSSSVAAPKASSDSPKRQ
jgi:excisionase family DNA binding protein